METPVVGGGGVVWARLGVLCWLVYAQFSGVLWSFVSILVVVVVVVEDTGEGVVPGFRIVRLL